MMTPEQAEAVLQLCGASDDRFGAASPETKEARVHTWAAILADVPVDYALSYAKRYYSNPPGPMLTPGGVRAAWVNAERAEAAKASTLDRIEAAHVASGGLSPYARTVLAWIRAGSKGDVPMPPTHTSLSASEVRQRRCRYKHCICDHEKCYDGWLDVESKVASPLVDGLYYPAVKRCPACNDATEPEVVSHGRRRR